MNFHDVISTRRSVRSFRPDPVPDEAVLRIVAAARFAPSANNRQPARLVAVRDDMKRREIARLCFEQDFIARAPVVLVCCAERQPSTYSWQGDSLALVDAAIFFDHVQLAARAEGLGTCWIGAFAQEGHEKMKSLLGVPPGWDIVALSPLGVPAENDAFHDRARRRDAEDLVGFDAFPSSDRAGTRPGPARQ